MTQYSREQLEEMTLTELIRVALDLQDQANDADFIAADMRKVALQSAVSTVTDSRDFGGVLDAASLYLEFLNGKKADA